MNYRYSKIILFGGIFLNITGCAPKGLVMKDYQDIYIVDKSLVISPMDRVPVIDNADDIADDIGEGVAEDVYTEFFFEVFQDSLREHSLFGGITRGSYQEAPDLGAQTLELEKGVEMNMMLPANGMSVIFESETPDFVLFLERHAVGRMGAQSGSFVGGMMVGGSFPKLYSTVDFVYWDNEQGQIVSYGRISHQEDILLQMNEMSWRNSVGKLAEGTVRAGPFFRR